MFTSRLLELRRKTRTLDEILDDLPKSAPLTVDKLGNQKDLVLDALRSDLQAADTYLSEKWAQIKGQIPQSLREIQYFRVTNRHLPEYQKYAHIDIQPLPSNATVIDIGSGVNQELSQDIRKLRPDITVINIDASLALPITNEPYDPLIAGSEHLSYFTLNGGEIMTKEDRLNRRQNHQPNTLAAVLPDIPLTKNSADLIIDLFGPALYLEKDKISEYFKNIHKTLKTNGEAHLYPIDNHFEFLQIGDNQTLIDISKSRALFALEQTNVFQNDYHFYEQPDNNGNIRLGLIITKNL